MRISQLSVLSISLIFGCGGSGEPNNAAGQPGGGAAGPQESTSGEGMSNQGQAPAFPSGGDRAASGGQGGQGGQRGGGLGHGDAQGGQGGQGGQQGQGQQGQGSGPGDIDLAQTRGLSTQEEIKAGDHVTLSGALSGVCPNAIRVDVIRKNAGPGGGEAGTGTLTSLDLAQPGQFELAVPRGNEVILIALCDTDGDGKISTGVDYRSKPMEFEELNDDRSGFEIAIGGPQ